MPVTESPTTSSSNLKELAAAGRMAELEAAWLAALEDPGPADGFLSAVKVLPRELRGQSAPLLVLLLEALQTRERHADVLPVVRQLLPFGTRSVDLGEAARNCVEGAYGNEDWCPLFVELSGLDGDGDLSDVLDRFDALMGLLPGRVVYHKSGWGEGLVESVDVGDQSFSVRFRADNMLRAMPFTTGLDVLTALPDDDLRARVLIDMDGLQADAADRPALLVRAVTRLHKGRCAAKDVKAWLCGAVIAERSWSSWWKKAKTAAMHDPWLLVENPTRPVFVLRQRALSPAEELAEAVSRAEGLTGVLDVVRGPLGLDPEPGIREQMLQHLTAALSAAGPDDAAEARLEALLTLHRNAALDAEAATAAFHDLVASLEGRSRSVASVLVALPVAGARREALELLAAARPQLWTSDLVDELGGLPPQLLEQVAAKLVETGAGDVLANRFHIFLLAPSKQPEAVMRLAKVFGAGLFDDVEGAPSREEVVMGLLHLAETQAPKALRGDKAAKEIMRVLQDVLLARGKKGLLVPFVKSAPRSMLEAVVGLLKRTRGMPDAIDTALHKHVEERFPGLVPREEIPFWESGGIFCSSAGIDKRHAEHRDLVDKKIPDNQDDIGRAASYGDLSENFEWQAAIERQRQLTEKAAAMSAELKVAKAIEDQVIPEGIVAPGMRVTYIERGETKTVTILGPWDVAEGVVSYQAPVAAGMLGASVGDVATLVLPEGSVDVTIEAVEPALKKA